MLSLSSPSLSLTPHHSPAPADGPLHGAVLGQWLSSKTADLDAVAPRVTPLVALVAGQVQVARGGTSQGEGSLLLCLQQLPGHLQPLHLVLRAPGYCRGDKDHVLSPDPVLQSCRGGEKEDRERLGRRADHPPGFRLGPKEKSRTEWDPYFLSLSPKCPQSLSQIH